MPDWLKWCATNPIASGVLGSLIAAGIISVLVWTRAKWMPKLFRPALRKTNAYPSDQSDEPGIQFPLKYYLETINDSRKSIAVRVVEFVPNAVTLQKFVTATVQVMFDKWCPRPIATDEVALLPNQRCRAWIGVDAKRFTKDDLDRLEGKIGTLVLTANGKRISFNL